MATLPVAFLVSLYKDFMFLYVITARKVHLSIEAHTVYIL